MKILFLAAFVLVIFCQTVNAEDEEKPKCYRCSDDKNEREKDKGLPKCSSDKSKWKTCEAKECWNTTTEVALGGDPIIERGCGSKGGKGIGVCFEFDAVLGKATTCTCNGNLCNGGYQIEASIVGIMTLVIFLQCFFFK